MKRITVLIITGLFFFSCYSQYYVPTAEELESFFNTKTLVVLDNNPMLEYNGAIKEVVKDNWTITEYDFITAKEFEEKRKDPQYSFLSLVDVNFERDKTGAVYNFLSLMLGGKALYITQMPEICSLPLSYINVEEDRYLYKLGALVRFMQNHVKLIHENPDLISNNIFKMYNKNTGDLEGKLLLLVEEELEREVNSISKVKKIYPHDVKIVSKDEVLEAIQNKTENCVFLHKVGPEGTKKNARCYKVLIGTDNSQFYYFDYHMISDKNPDGLLAKDLKKISK